MRNNYFSWLGGMDEEEDPTAFSMPYQGAPQATQIPMMQQPRAYNPMPAPGQSPMPMPNPGSQPYNPSLGTPLAGSDPTNIGGMSYPDTGLPEPLPEVTDFTEFGMTAGLGAEAKDMESNALGNMPQLMNMVNGITGQPEYKDFMPQVRSPNRLDEMLGLLGV